MIPRLVKSIIVIGISAVAFLCGGISFDHQWSYFQSLQTTSAVVFGVIGAWMALVYPSAVSFIVKNRNVNEISNLDEITEAEELLIPLIWSSCILAIVLIVGPVSEIAKRIPFLISHLDISRKISFTLLAILTMAQLWTILLSLVPIHRAKDKIDEIKTRQRILASTTPETLVSTTPTEDKEKAE